MSGDTGLEISLFVVGELFRSPLGICAISSLIRGHYRASLRPCICKLLGIPQIDCRFNAPLPTLRLIDEAAVVHAKSYTKTATSSSRRRRPRVTSSRPYVRSLTGTSKCTTRRWLWSVCASAAILVMYVPGVLRRVAQEASRGLSEGKHVFAGEAQLASKHGSRVTQAVRSVDTRIV